MKLSKKNKPWIIGGIVLLVIIVIVVLIAHSKKKAKEAAEAAELDQNTAGLSAVNPATTVVYNTYVGTDQEKKSKFAQLPDYTGGNLQIGDRNKGVYLLQAALNKTNSAGLTVDGVFGGATATALQRFYQKSFADAETLAKIWKNYKV